MASCVVIGADGFIGSHLSEHLAQAGHKVIAFDRFRNDQPRNLKLKSNNLTLMQGNFLNRGDLERAVVGADYVFHLVSTTTPASSSADPFIDIDTNLRMSVELFSLCAEAKVKRVIFPSTGGAIYGRDQDEPLKETDLTEPLSPYAIGKLAIEGYLRYFKRNHGLDYLALRIANPYGERQNLVGNQGVIPIFLNLLRQGKPVTVYGDGTMTRDYLYIKDLVEMIGLMFAADCQHSLYNLGSGEGVKLMDLIDCLGEVTGTQPKVKFLPARATDAHHVLLDISRYRQEFGHGGDTGLKTGIEKTWEYIQEVAG